MTSYGFGGNGRAHPAQGEKKGGSSPILVAGFVVFAALMLGALAIGAVAYTLLVEETTTTTTSTTTTSTTTTTSSTTTTSTTTTTSKPTTSSSFASTTTSSSTTTFPCGGDFQWPCPGQNCSEGYVLGSFGLCQPIGCVPSVSSGKDGCGDWAFDFCR